MSELHVSIPLADDIARLRTLTEALQLAVEVDRLNQRGEPVPPTMTHALRGLLLMLHRRVIANPGTLDHAKEYA